MLIFFFLKNEMEYEEHKKRAWSVDFSRMEPSMLVSGSDNCKVLKRTISTLDNVLESEKFAIAYSMFRIIAR